MKQPPDEQIPLPTKEESAEIIKPIRDILCKAIAEAIADWPKLYEKMLHILSSRSQSSIIHDHIAYHAKRLLASVAGVKASTKHNIFTVAIEESADIRFKKLDRKLRSNNVRTNQNSRYSMQLRLDGFDDLPRLTAGYQLDDLRMALSKAVVTLQVGRSVRYVLPLDDDSAQQVMPFPNPVNPVAPASPARRRVRAKDVSQKIVGKE